MREGKQWEIGKGRWIISSEWIIIYCGVHSTVLSSPPGLSAAPSLPRTKPIHFSLLKNWCHHEKKIVLTWEGDLTGVRFLILMTICMKVKGLERITLRTTSLDQNKGQPVLPLNAAFVAMTTRRAKVCSKI